MGDDHWIPTQRFEVVQKNKVRGVDSATSNGINMATVVTEKLELPCTDANVAVIKWLRSRLPDKPLRGWVLDERRAYRQVPISPGHRKWSVVALKEFQHRQGRFLCDGGPLVRVGLRRLQL